MKFDQHFRRTAGGSRVIRFERSQAQSRMARRIFWTFWRVTRGCPREITKRKVR